jgi:hypothetical protein
MFAVVALNYSSVCITENLFVLFQFVPHGLDVLRVEGGQVVHPPLQIRDPYFAIRQQQQQQQPITICHFEYYVRV